MEVTTKATPKDKVKSYWGFLIVRVCEVSGLHEEPGKEVYVQLHLSSTVFESAKTSKISLKSPSKTDFLAWNEEFVFKLPLGKQCTLEASVKTESFLVDKNHGSGTIALGDDSEDSRDENVPVGKNGTLRLQMRRIALGNMPYLPKLSYTWMPRLRVLLPRQSFYPGQTIEGAILVYTAEPLNFKQLQLTVASSAFSSYSDIIRTQPKSFLEWELLRPSKYSTYLLETVKYGSSKENHCVGARLFEAWNVPVGISIVPFKCALPMHLPLSFFVHNRTEALWDGYESGQNQHGHTTTSITAKAQFIDDKWTGSEAELNVCADWEKNMDILRKWQEGYAIAPENHLMSGTRLAETEFVTATWKAPEIVYIGVPFTVVVTVDSKLSKPLVAMELAVMNIANTTGRANVRKDAWGAKHTGDDVLPSGEGRKDDIQRSAVTVIKNETMRVKEEVKELVFENVVIGTNCYPTMPPDDQTFVVTKSWLELRYDKGEADDTTFGWGYKREVLQHPLIVGIKAPEALSKWPSPSNPEADPEEIFYSDTFQVESTPIHSPFGTIDSGAFVGTVPTPPTGAVNYKLGKSLVDEPPVKL